MSLQVEDRIISYNNKPIFSNAEMLHVMQQARSNGLKEIPLVIKRGKKQMSFIAKLG